MGEAPELSFITFGRWRELRERSLDPFVLLFLRKREYPGLCRIRVGFSITFSAQVAKRKTVARNLSRRAKSYRNGTKRAIAHYHCDRHAAFDLNRIYASDGPSKDRTSLA